MEERFETFTILIAKASRCIYKIKSGEMAEYNLKSSHVSCLYYIYKENSLTAKELCDLCSEDKANISRTIKFLENNDYLVCETNTPQRYQSPFRLTNKGIEIAEFITKKIDSILEKASEGLAEEDRKIMYHGLSLVNNNLNKLCKTYDFNKEDK